MAVNERDPGLPHDFPTFATAISWRAESAHTGFGVLPRPNRLAALEHAMSDGFQHIKATVDELPQYDGEGI